MTEFYSIFHEPAAPGAGTVDLVASGPDAAARGRAAIEACGFEVGACHDVGATGVDQLSTHPVWIELDRDQGHVLDHWLMAFDAHSEHSRLPATVAMDAALLDPVAALVGPHVELLVAPDAAARAAALGLMVAREGAGRVGDARGSDPAALRRLSEEVQRIAATLSKMSDGGLGEQGAALAATAPAPEGESTAELSAETVRSVIRARRLREDYFPADLFHDPAWDMMLDLLAAEIQQIRVPVSSLCMAAAVPATTALRWIKTLTAKKLFVRRADPHDGRRVFVELSPDASRAMRGYFAKLGPRFAI
ncbi:winged helix DNA-binding protein [Sphingomicrobium astaxanthinifaciens]|uniref:winged helix DNA-binding protein n=1 Tax=Sphingomicrobium astaxanthinifaciens TaxID=1227949 RepID=UPI001FCAB6EF|nr:winged helix DNA-binding protein [Sphingomicrobium astaxanthinifaciens]MCJ7421918.1 MarR family winged helix-turn-helix transcriptional regulator [Sphingomicrobium astaxanthinifaciens]